MRCLWYTQFPLGARRSPRLLSSALLKTIGPITWSAILLISGCEAPAGGGGSTQTAPDSVEAGEPAVIELELSVWGSREGIQGRYTGVEAYYRLVGESKYGSVKPRLVLQEKDREFYKITIPAYPEGTQGEVEYFITLNLDGHPSRINGMKKVKIAQDSDATSRPAIR